MIRRGAVRTGCICLPLGFVLGCAASGPVRVAPGGSGRPNILLILADDMGFSDLGCYGSEIQTPNLDRLAVNGVRFTQFYNAARCCPTRASLLTGLYPHQAGVGHMVDDSGHPGYRGFLNDRCVTMAEALRRGGYRTLMAGKWHVGEERPHWPLDRGFEKYFGLVSGASNYFRLDPERTMAVDNTPYKPTADDFYMTDAFTDHAIAFLDAYGGKAKPFFLYVAYTAPHWPLHALPEDVARYKGKYMDGWDVLRTRRHQRMIELGLVDPSWPLTPRDSQAPAWEAVEDKAERDLKMAVYAAQIDRLDHDIGRILSKIRRLGIEDNTLVLFLADNGGCAEEINRGTPGVPPGPKESFLSYGLPWANASNTPFRRYKHWVHEGGIATPLIAYWPATIMNPAVTHQPGHIIDIMATCLDVAGVDYPKTYDGRQIVPLEGRSLLPIFRGRQRDPHKAMFWEHEGNRAVRQGDSKLVSRYPDNWELYDLKADRTELNNIADMHPEKVRELAGLYDAWAERVGVEPWKEIKRKTAGRSRSAPGDRVPSATRSSMITQP